MNLLQGIKSVFGAGLGDVAEKVFDGIDRIDNKDLKIEVFGQLQTLMIGLQSKVVEAQSQIIQLEAKGNWLQRSWRPILALTFGFIVVYSKFIAPAFGLPNTELNPEFWTLLELMIGGYVVGRSIEKTMPQIVEVLRKQKR